MTPQDNHLSDMLAQAAGFYESGEFDMAVEVFLALEQAARAQGNLQICAVALTNLGAAYGGRGDYRSAMSVLQQARQRHIENGDWLGECKVTISLATALGHLDQQQQSMQTWQAALDLARRMVNPELAAIATDGLAGAMVKMGQPQEGLIIYQKLLGYYEKIGDEIKQIDTLIEMARVEIDQGDTAQVEKHAQQALFLARKHNDAEKIAYCLYKLGTLYQDTGFNLEARDRLTQAVDSYRALNKLQELGMALNNLGIVYAHLGMYQDALNVYQEALKIAETCGSKTDQGGTLHGIGHIYHQIGQFNEANAYYRRALQLTEEEGDWHSASLTLTNLGVATADMSKDDEALSFLQQAIFYQKKAGDLLSQGKTLISIASLFQRAKDYERALLTLQEALAIQQQTGDRNSQAVSYMTLGEIMIGQEHFEEALQQYQKALVLFREVSNPDGQIRAIYSMAQVHGHTGHLPAAVEVLEQAITIIESIRLNLVSESLRTSYFSNKQNIYALYVEVLLAMERRADAFRMIERSKARSFLDLLSEAQVAFQEDLDPKLRDEELYLLANINEIHKQIDTLQEEETGQADQLASLRGHQQELERKYQINQGEIRKMNPRYSALTQPAIWGIEQVQRELLDDHTALLEYILGEGVSTLFVVLKDTFEVFRLPPRAEIELRVKELRASLTLHRYLHGDALYHDLVQPAEAMIRGKDLLIVADGVLHYLPFAMLLTRPPEGSGGGSEQLPGTLRSAQALNEDNLLTNKLEADLAGLPPFDFPNLHYLLLDHSIRYVPSASVACFMAKQQTFVRRGGLQITALADPLLKGQDDLPPGAVRSLRTGLAPLPFTSEEVWTLAGLFESGLPQGKTTEFHSDRVQLFTGEKATKQQVLALTDGSRDYRFLHIATHGLLNIENPQFSGLLFSSDNGENSYWQTFEIFKSHIPAETVVLSACETGLGKVIRGEGLIGLTRAFLYAGASRVCVSLWKVADISTPVLMKYFYQDMLAGNGSARALRQAQLKLLEEGMYSHPYFWAAFVVVGTA